MTMSQLLDSHTQLEVARRDRDLSRMLKGVVTNVHCLAKFSREVPLHCHQDLSKVILKVPGSKLAQG